MAVIRCSACDGLVDLDLDVDHVMDCASRHGSCPECGSAAEWDEDGYICERGCHMRGREDSLRGDR